ncbi:hypothetical protein BGW37DRAFT_476572 [Umbelopsis sp. PMI_123]|nr:hypothetical protein BGW37DRAFT_476572 [Umbelopsis sp. PMI_123]
MVEASWILAVGAVVLIGFWVAVTAINTDKTAWEVLQLLALGALFAPEIGDTLLYEPQVIGVLLFVYLFLTTVLLSALLTASFLATFLSLRNQLDNLVALQFARLTVDSLKAGGGSGFGSYIPGILVECILVYPLVCLVNLYRIITRHRIVSDHYEQSYQNVQKTEKYINRWREIVFYTTYSPFFITATLIELLVDIARKLISYLQRMTKTSEPITSISGHV